MKKKNNILGSKMVQIKASVTGQQKIVDIRVTSVWQTSRYKPECRERSLQQCRMR